MAAYNKKSKKALHKIYDREGSKLFACLSKKYLLGFLR